MTEVWRVRHSRGALLPPPRAALLPPPRAPPVAAAGSMFHLSVVKESAVIQRSERLKR